MKHNQVKKQWQKPIYWKKHNNTTSDRASTNTRWHFAFGAVLS